MESRYDSGVHELRRAVMEGPGQLDREIRQAAFSGAEVPPDATAYVEKIRRHAYKVTDGDVEALLAAGWSEDQVFELTVATALGEGYRRIEAGLREVEATWVRLQRVANGQRLLNRMVLRIMELATRMEPADVVKLMNYRPRFFGAPYSNLLHEVMRGPSEWSAGERELFAAFTSRLNQCPFWTGAHGAVASLALGDGLTKAVLADWRTAPVDPGLRAALALVEKLTLDPDTIDPDDIQAARTGGLSAEAIVDAVYVCGLFNAIDRIADALSFDLPPAEAHRRASRFLLQRGYRMPAFLAR